MRKRWCRHLQRICGTKQLWEVLAFTGRFDIDFFEKTLSQKDLGGDAEATGQDSAARQKRAELFYKTN